MGHAARTGRSVPFAMPAILPHGQRTAWIQCIAAFRELRFASNRLRNGVWPSRIFSSARWIGNHPPRSTSGTSILRPDSGGQLELERVAFEQSGIAIAFVEHHQALTTFPLFSRISPRGERIARFVKTRLFLKFAARGSQRIFGLHEFALGNAPGTQVLFRPEGSAGMDLEKPRLPNRFGETSADRRSFSGSERACFSFVYGGPGLQMQVCSGVRRIWVGRRM